MTFFELQHRARRKTGILVFYFVLAILMIILAINAVVYFAVGQTMKPLPTIAEWMNSPYWLWISGATLIAIIIGSMNTMLKLRGGGRAVAELVGARKVHTSTKDINERRLINVVEEMSIASGTPVPAIYVLDSEYGINAFVAGLRPTEAVLVATRGTLETLSRDELQGVVAHEYSHILNGDMRINIRLMGILAGIVIIGQIGRIMMRSGGRSRGKGNGQAMMIGLAVFVIGYIGLFFAALIKAAISRQREFLADASAVQFTRNPSGIAGALWKIKQHAGGSLLDNSHSDDISHFCFGETVSSMLSSMMATHPPLDVRIKTIDPSFMRNVKAAAESTRRSDATTETPAVAGVSQFASGAAIDTTANAVVQNIGTVNPAQLGFSAALLASMPSPVEAAAHQPQQARQLIYALLLNATKGEHHAQGLQLIQEMENPQVQTEVAALLPSIASLSGQARLLLLNMTLPALKELEQPTRALSLKVAEALIKVDNSFTIFEFALLTILKQHLSEDAARDIPVRYYKFNDVTGEISLLLSVMARVGAGDENMVHESYHNVMKQFLPAPGLPLGKGECSLAALNKALHKLNMLAPLLKQSVIQACADCVIHDNKVLPGEAQMLQAISTTLDCPMPPLLPT